MPWRQHNEERHVCRNDALPALLRAFVCGYGIWIAGSPRQTGLCCVQAADFWALGLEPIALSAISGSGSGDLLDRLVAALPPPAPADAEKVRDLLACSIARFEVLLSSPGYCCAVCAGLHRVLQAIAAQCVQACTDRQERRVGCGRVYMVVSS